jgi:hypothetical protein
VTWQFPEPLSAAANLNRSGEDAMLIVVWFAVVILVAPRCVHPRPYGAIPRSLQLLQPADAQYFLRALLLPCG